MSLRALYDKVQCLVTTYQGEWDSTIQSLTEFRERTLESIWRERDAQAPKKTQNSGKHSCSYLVNPKKVSLGKSRRSSKQTIIQDTAKDVENEEPVVTIRRSARSNAVAQKKPSLEVLNSPQEQRKPKKRRGRPKKKSANEEMVPDTPESKRSASQASRQRSSIDRCLTPKRSADSLVPMQESRKLIEQTPWVPNDVAKPSPCESVESKEEESAKRTPQQTKKASMSKQSSTSRQIFSPYGLDSTKKKAEAYENHIAKLAVPDIHVRLVETLPSEVSKPRMSSAQKRRSALAKPCDNLILAKAARMSQTQKRSSLVRYHLQVAMNQIVRKVSLERRRSSLIERKRSSCLGSENAIETITEQDTPKSTSLHVINSVEDLPKQKRSKQSDMILPVVVAKKLDATFIRSQSGSKNQSPHASESDTTTSPPMDSPSESSGCSKSNKMNPQVQVERLSQKQIDELSRATVQSPSARDDDSNSDSYISEDEPVSSTPVVIHFTKKVPLLIQANTPLAHKNKYPGSEPRPAHQSRVAFLASVLNSSNPGKRNSSTATTVRTMSFLKSRPPSQDFAVQKMDRLKEEFKRKKEKEELAFRRREQMLKDKVFSQKKKLNEKMAKAAENRLQREKELQGKNRQLELQLQQAEEKKKVQAEKRREEMEQRRLMRIKKEAEMEERRKQEEAAKLAKLKEQEALDKVRLQEQEKLKAVISHHNSSLQKKAIMNSTIIKEKTGPSVASKTDMNLTYNCEGSQDTTDNYDITPHRSELPPQELKDPENYDIADLDSGDETDDDTYPRKNIPKWAEGPLLKSALLQQARRPPNLNVLFPTMPNIDLIVVFGTKNPKKMRTSSALWYSPPPGP